MLNLIGVFVAFILIIVLIRKKFNFGLSMIFGSLVVGLFSLQEIQPIEIPRAFIEALIYSYEDNQIDTETIELAILMTLIFILAKCMQETGAVEKLINSLRTIFSKGGTLGVIPAIYGLMPVPGGALFSAPSIDAEGDKYDLNKDQKNFLNVWFRHIWFPIYPISSAMILICSKDFSDINIYNLIIADMPSFIVFIAVGIFFLKFFIRNSMQSKNIRSKKEFKGLIYLLPPIVPVIIYVVLLLIGLPYLKDIQKSVFIAGVIVSIILLRYLVRMDWKSYSSLVRHSLSFNLALAIIGIMIFREMLNTSQANIILADVIGNLSFPPIVIIIIIPILLGLITGYNFGAIALSYFLVEPLFQFTGINIIGLTSMIFMSSLVGYLVSPIHLCNVVSSDYLKTDVTHMYKMYLPAVTVLLLAQIIVVLFAFPS